MDAKILNNLIEDAADVYPDNEILQKVTVCQAILESGFLNGGSKLANQYFNLFGIKGVGTNGSIDLSTTEYVDGQPETVVQTFAVNTSWAESFAQHKATLDKDRYAPVRSADTVTEAFRQLRLCGYATDPKYPAMLEAIYNKYVESYY